MRRLPALLAAVLLAVLFYFRGAAQKPAVLETAGAIQIISIPENGQQVNNGYPALIQDRAGNLWCAFVSARQRTPLFRRHDVPYEEGDAIIVRTRRQGKWSGEVKINGHFGVNFAPQLAEDKAGNIIVVWSSRREGVDGIWWRRLGQDFSLGGELRVPAAGTLEGQPALAAAPDGRLYLAFQTFRNGSSDIVLYLLEGSGWRRLPDPPDTPAQEMRPRLSAAPDGAIWAAWDSYENGKYNVMVRRYDPTSGTWGTAEKVPGDGQLDAYAPDIATDSQGRLWVAYARNEVLDHAFGLRGARKDAAPRPSVRMAVREAPGWRFPALIAPNAEAGFVDEGDLPRIAADSDGAVWIVWQRLPGHVDWKVTAAAYRAGQWTRPEIFGTTEPVSMDGPQRRADQRPSIVATASGRLVFAYERGRGAFKNRDIYLRELAISSAGGDQTALLTVPAKPLSARPRLMRRPPQRSPVHSVSGERRRLYFGDLHNHVLVDDGHQGFVDQLFAIHRDRFGSDFAATTSHGDSNKLLISELAHNDLLTEASLQAGRFISIPGFEWTQGDFVVPRAGHRHVIYETPGPLYRPTEGHSDSIREFSDLMAKTNGLLFAHHITRGSTGGTDWSYVNVKVEPAVEMCSSWGRFEFYQNPGHIRGPEMRNCSVQDVWRMGWRLGLIGGSDGHNLFGDRIQGLTGVYATELSRTALFDAIRNRRTYATTGEPIVVDFRVNGHFMGSEISASEGPVMEGSVEGTAKLISVEVVKQVGEKYPTVYRAPVDGNRSKVWWRDPDFQSSTLYYLRVTQELEPALALRYAGDPERRFPTEMAWTSPVWVARK
jgi:hypothetical protein